MSVAEAIGRFNAAHSIGEVLGVELVRTAGTNGGEFHGPCPLCGGTDRLRAYPVPSDGRVRAVCRRCERSGDPLRWAMWREGMDPDATGATARFLRERGFLVDAPTATPRPPRHVELVPLPGPTPVPEDDPARVAARRLLASITGPDVSDVSPDVSFRDSRENSGTFDVTDVSDVSRHPWRSRTREMSPAERRRALELIVWTLEDEEAEQGAPELVERLRGAFRRSPSDHEWDRRLELAEQVPEVIRG